MSGTWYRNKVSGEIIEPTFWDQDYYNPADPPRPNDTPPYPGTVQYHSGDEVPIALRFMQVFIDDLEVYDPNNPPAPPPPPPPPPPNPAAIREERTRRLSITDWTQVPDVPEGVAETWVEYRQQLRDVPQQLGFPDSFNWPVLPA